MSFGVAISALVVAFFVHLAPCSADVRLIGPLHDAFITLSILTALSALYFAALRPDDGANASHYRTRAGREVPAS